MIVVMRPATTPTTRPMLAKACMRRPSSASLRSASVHRGAHRESRSEYVLSDERPNPTNAPTPTSAMPPVAHPYQGTPRDSRSRRGNGGFGWAGGGATGSGGGLQVTMVSFPASAITACVS